MKKWIFSLTLIWSFLVFALPAQAYLDPGSGSMALQALLGALAAVMVVVKIYWSRLITYFGLKKKTEPEPPDSSSTNLN